eukprot:scaffold91823_cov66-Phaeocystis_antarctica.AAC.3
MEGLRDASTPAGLVGPDSSPGCDPPQPQPGRLDAEHTHPGVGGLPGLQRRFPPRAHSARASRRADGVALRCGGRSRARPVPGAREPRRRARRDDHAL